MWRQVVLPVIVVGVSWFTMSVLTTLYVLSLDASYERVFEENVTSIDAAGLLREELWHLQAELGQQERNTDWRKRLATFDRREQTQLVELERTATTDEERELTVTLQTLMKQYRQQLTPSDSPHES